MTEIIPAVTEMPAISVLESAPEILLRNQQSKDNATKVYNNLKALIDDQGMNDVYDSQLSVLVDKCKATATRMNEQRSPITQALDRYKKEFTTLEANVKTIVDWGQGERNAYATIKMQERRKLEEEAERKLAKEKEVIEIKRLVTITYKGRFGDILTDLKTANLNWFNSIKLDNGIIPDALQVTCSDHITNIKSLESKDIISLSKIDLTRFKDGPVVFTPRFHNLEEIQGMAKDIFYSIMPAFETELAKEVVLQKQELSDKLPSKIAELEDLALADVAETEKILEEKRKRELADKIRLEKAAEERTKNDNAAAAVQAAGQQAAAIVDSTVVEECPKVAESFDIKLSTPALYLVLTQFWYEKEGKTLSTEKFESFTFKRIKAFCEAYALKNGEFIQQSGITYEPKYKAK